MSKKHIVLNVVYSAALLVVGFGVGHYLPYEKQIPLRNFERFTIPPITKQQFAPLPSVSTGPQDVLPDVPEGGNTARSMEQPVPKEVD